MMINSPSPSLIAALVSAGLLAACGGGSGSAGTTPAQGSLRVSLTDAPACGYDAVNVTVKKVRVHQSSSAAEGESGWTDITLNPARKINLLNLTNGVLDELGQTELPAGRYTQLRLVLDANSGQGLANSIVLTGTTDEVPLDTPSAVQSGIKLNNAFEVGAGEKVDLVLDFDACKSVVTKGNGKFALKPVIKMIPSALNGIDGYVDKAILDKNIMVTAQQNGVIVSATVPNPDTGKFALTRLAPGDYDVVFTGDNHAAAVIAKVPVASTTSVVPLSTSAAPIKLQTAATADATVSGKLTLNPASTTEEVAYVAAKQSFASGPTVTVKYRGADVATGSFELKNLPTVAPQLGQYSSTLPISLSTKNDTVPGTGKYTLEASAEAYKTQSATVDASSGNATQDFTLTK